MRSDINICLYFILKGPGILNEFIFFLHVLQTAQGFGTLTRAGGDLWPPRAPPSSFAGVLIKKEPSTPRSIDRSVHSARPAACRHSAGTVAATLPVEGSSFALSQIACGGFFFFFFESVHGGEKKRPRIDEAGIPLSSFSRFYYSDSSSAEAMRLHFGRDLVK